MSQIKENGVASTSKNNAENPKVRFKQLYKKALGLGLSEEDFNKIDAIKEIRKAIQTDDVLSRIWNIVWKCCLLVLSITSLIVAVAVFVFVFQWPIENKTLFKVWFALTGEEAGSERSEICAVNAIDYMAEMFRPPTSCDFCRNVSSVEKLEHVSQDLFEKVYAYSSVPVVITDGTKNWTASKVFSYNFFKSLYSSGSPALQNVEENCQFFPYKTNFSTLEEVFEMNEDRALMKDGSAPWYIGWSNCDLSAANTLRGHYSRPYFLPQVAESSKTDWIFMGSPGYGADLHIDAVEHPSWQAQITGTKRWTLEPPPECYFQCPKSIQVVIHPGEIIVLDTNRWYHSTLNVGDDISITIGSEYD
ncbi:uncharacterized protein LOC133188829 [Saccostrea echinata]|uniref:uncharacterized protein LOC133188829 n=1 Tax=Saccostrea echinata TaxID=191078 RepID=UPI002A823451|nr:uncharacterized protein LOC133188829 [Saccostrea echinata]